MFIVAIEKGCEKYTFPHWAVIKAPNSGLK